MNRRQFLAWAACAAPGLMAVAEPLRPVVMATGEWPPYTSASLPGNGLLCDLVEQAMARAGARPVWRFVSWPMVEKLVLEGQALAGLPYVRTQERAQRFDFSVPLHAGRTMLFYRVGSHAQQGHPKSLAELSRYKLAGPRGYWWEAELNRMGAELLYTSDEAAAFKVLAAGRVDFVPQDELVGLSVIAATLPGRGQEFGAMPLPVPQANEQLHLILSRRYPQAAEWRLRLDKALTEVLAEGQLDKAIAAYKASQQAAP
ncbi:hypothetical protein GCM10007907_05350 [Chitinimonas prasina]|uniref:Solute-binding protein family 3/N-terminal domain-containing protein n=1 Tax=Chitinimonas prasina TaxID=1434937 RepID=A0ABQ5Y9W9_9NEIS|nr:transporter substrate-binding domain-containing protein [Chitinimonas prasina]GLR11745.1 hypothetical protein GCM10007907_05350 [Chitinimonas prasina]